ncbi:MAG: nucleotidyltransferase family protein [Bacteroidales bacterium]|nr:nucleotidyltransferase family protein [Clostridium sp.]MCM1203131.1 nucleotidyltransferase family protein [Bacteroidales bacterium]
MKHIGIIAEYNPFHNGHAYQIQEAKTLFPGKNVLVMMSGDFVQRGEPAIFNKYLRTQCALFSGADIVFELPSLFACASAEHFASAAVLSLSATGMVDTLCFGAECDNLQILEDIADVLLNEPAAYQTILKEKLRSGLSFPQARSIAVSAFLQDNRLEDILKQPNNILAIEYIKAIRKHRLAVTPCPIKRQGSGYHELTLSDTFSSASALRRKLENGGFSFLEKYVPAPAFHLLSTSDYAKPLFFFDFYPLLQYALWQNSKGFRQYYDVPDALSDRLMRYTQYPPNAENLLSGLSCRNYTDTRIKRALLNILLQREKKTMLQAKEQGYLFYLRLLGFRHQSTHLLKEMKACCPVPIINKVADAKHILSPACLPYFEKELQTSSLYKQVFTGKYGISMPSEYEQTVIITNS